jgi:hypothetical protein
MTAKVTITLPPYVLALKAIPDERPHPVEMILPNARYYGAEIKCLVLGVEILFRRLARFTTAPDGTSGWKEIRGLDEISWVLPFHGEIHIRTCLVAENSNPPDRLLEAELLMLLEEAARADTRMRIVRLAGAPRRL